MALCVLRDAPDGAPQDEVGLQMAHKNVLILRSAHRARLEGRNPSIQESAFP
jgi:hypothetical protein